MPNPPTHTLTRTSETSFTASIQCQANLSADLYLRRASSASQQYNLFASRSGPGTISVTGRTPNEYYQTFTVTRDTSNNVSTPYFASIDLNIPDTVLSAIKSKWNSTPALTSKFPGGLFANEAPEAIEGKPLVMPYCIVRDDDTEFEYTMSDVYFETSAIYFSVFAPGANAVESCMAVLREQFDWKSLPFAKTDSVTISMRPAGESVISENFRYKDGNLIFRGSLNYDIMVNRIL